MPETFHAAVSEVHLQVPSGGTRGTAHGRTKSYASASYSLYNAEAAVAVQTTSPPPHPYGNHHGPSSSSTKTSV